MHLIKSTKIITASVALMLTTATVAFAVGASQGQPTLVVHQASDLLGGAAPEESEAPPVAPKPKPERTTFTTSFPEAKAVPRPTRAAAKSKATTKKHTPASTSPPATRTPRPARSAPAPVSSPTTTPDPLTWLVSTLTSGL